MANRPFALPAPTRSLPRLVLGPAVLLARAATLLPRTHVAFAQDAKPSAGTAATATPAAPAPPASPAPPSPATTPVAKHPKAKSSVSAKIDVATDKAGNSTVTIEKSGSNAAADDGMDDEED